MLRRRSQLGNLRSRRPEEAHAPRTVHIGLPIADRRISHDFYRDGLGLEAIGEPAEDGMPEPLQFVLNDGVHLMLVPTVGFGWVIGDRAVAERGHSECLLGLEADTEAAVDERVARAVEAGAEIVDAAERKPWGYTAAFADPDGHLWS